MKRLALIGGGGFSLEIAEVALMNGWEIVGYFALAKSSSEYRYLGKFDYLIKPDFAFEYIFPAWGAVDRVGLRNRSEEVRRLSERWVVPDMISPRAIVSPSVVIGRGSYIAHGVVINPKSRIGDFTVINTNSTIGHDVQIGNDSIVSGNVFIGGGSKIGKRTLIGPGATVLHSINIGSDVIVSLGTTIGRDVPDGKTAVPNLAKIF